MKKGYANYLIGFIALVLVVMSILVCVKSITDTALNTVSEKVDTFSASIETLSNNENALMSSSDDIATKFDTLISDLPALLSAIPKESENDEEEKFAEESYQIFLSEEDIDKRLIYLGNAINHDPSKLDYYSSYWEAIKNSDSPELYYEHFLTILNTGFAYAESKDIGILIGIHDELIEAIVNVEKETEDNSEYDEVWVQTWNTIYSELKEMQDPESFEAVRFNDLCESLDTVFQLFSVVPEEITQEYSIVDYVYSLFSMYFNSSKMMEDLKAYEGEAYLNRYNLYIPSVEESIRSFASRDKVELGGFSNILEFMSDDLFQFYMETKHEKDKQLDVMANYFISSYEKTFKSSNLPVYERKQKFSDITKIVKNLVTLVDDITSVTFIDHYERLNQYMHDEFYSDYQIYASHVLLKTKEALADCRKNECLLRLFQNGYFNISVEQLIPQLQLVHQSLWKDSYLEDSVIDIELLIEEYPIRKKVPGDV